jgi:hypothetical protein
MINPPITTGNVDIVSINAQRVQINGIEYFKNFLSIVRGDLITIYNAYDSRNVIAENIPFGDITINGLYSPDAAQLQANLLPVIYTRDTLGNTGGGAVESVTGAIVNNTDPQNPIINTPTKAQIGLGNVDNTSDVNKPISTAVQTALNGKEDVANKSTNTSLGTSNTLYPTQNAVKTYVDAQVLTATIPDATTTVKGKVKLAGDLGGTADLPTVPALSTKQNTLVSGTNIKTIEGQSILGSGNIDLQKADVGLANVDNTTDLLKPISTATQTALNLKENLANKSISIPTDGTSDVKYPSAKAVKDYVDGAVTGVTVPDATTLVKGKIKLAGDLSGTADLPTVPALATKENTITAGTTAQYWRGDKSWQTLNKSAVGLSNVDNTSDANKPISTATQTALNGKEDLANKSTATTLGTSNTLYPTQNAVKVYVDSQVASATIPDATTTVKGKVKLAGDLGGTADLPTVPALANKENTIVAGTTAQYYRGDKSWQTLDKSAVGLGNVDNTSDLNKPISNATQTALNNKQNTLVSGVNIKTINGQSVLGSGDLVVGGGGGSQDLQSVTDLGNSTTNPIYFNGNVPIYGDNNSVFLGATVMPDGQTWPSSLEQTGVGVWDGAIGDFVTSFYSKRNIACSDGQNTKVLRVAPGYTAMNFDLIIKHPAENVYLHAKGNVVFDFNSYQQKYRIEWSNVMNTVENYNPNNIGIEFSNDGLHFALEVQNYTSSPFIVNINANVL